MNVEVQSLRRQKRPVSICPTSDRHGVRVPAARSGGCPSGPVTRVTEAGLIDSGHFDPRIRQELLLRCPQLRPYLDEPRTWTD
jgi:hypothetical protein